MTLVFRHRPIPQPGSYRDYTLRQREKVAGLTLASPEIEDWIRFAQDTDGDWPSFPLPRIYQILQQLETHFSVNLDNAMMNEYEYTITYWT